MTALPNEMLAEMSMSTGKSLPRDAGQAPKALERASARQIYQLPCNGWSAVLPGDDDGCGASGTQRSTAGLGVLCSGGLRGLVRE